MYNTILNKAQGVAKFLDGGKTPHIKRNDPMVIVILIVGLYSMLSMSLWIWNNTLTKYITIVNPIDYQTNNNLLDHFHNLWDMFLLQSLLHTLYL
tara:strand:- start:417 stop:701 length:285 start_codon:yes stop_codon:yes gene_type:complete